MNLAKDPQNFPPKKSQAIQSIEKNHNKRKQDFEPKGNSLWVALFPHQFIYKKSKNYHGSYCSICDHNIEIEIKRGNVYEM